MAKNTAERLRPVIEMAERDEREAAKKLGAAQGQLAQAAGKLKDLEQYRDDYHSRWREQGTHGGITGGQWFINYQHFMSHLETAITQQERSVGWYQENLEKLRVYWQQRYARLEGLRKLVERHEQEAKRLIEKREQKQMDEFAQRRSMRQED